GIIVQLPLPEHVDKDAVIEAINPTKDVDGLTSKTLFTPATAKGILTLLDYYKVKIKGKKVVMVGKSQLVGLPITLSLLNRHATVTVCHKQTRNLSQETRQADILIVATGVPGLITPKHVSKGQVVIDVGITVLRNKKVVGDVDFENVSKIVQAITPVPGGVGPMTVYSLFENLLKACLRRQAYELNSSKR
ncbi:bifunctional 5,10-methylenetetrahydrofolate dehydrogenase/5,10-methenyltetrahydrofolate cyclohydrolase, partial [Candidatus Parcubacteria bacterium]|nr:bifunctional 5,10-methylenetetrahydrofolate dehydrogenase/5,10-methenyltetrahydrofolate cyclohydrolase [Candidatus Parcubacteria bacterium]